MVSFRALAVTHDDDLRSDCATLLTELGYSVTAVPDGRLAMEAARLQRPHLVLLGNSPVDVAVKPLAHALRRFCDPYLVVVNLVADPDGHTKAVEWGADDVLTAPLDPADTRDRLDLLQRRPKPAMPERLEQRVFEALVVDVAAREVVLDESTVELTRTEFDLLVRLSETPRRVLTRGQLIESVWGLDWYSDGHLLDVHIGNLRHKLGESGRAPRFIETVRGVGFRFNPQPNSSGDGQFAAKTPKAPQAQSPTQ